MQKKETMEVENEHRNVFSILLEFREMIITVYQNGGENIHQSSGLFKDTKNREA